MPVLYKPQNKPGVFGTVFRFITALGRVTCSAADRIFRFVFRCVRAPFSLALFLASKLVFSVKDGLRAAGGGRRGAARYLAMWLLPVLAGAALIGTIRHYASLQVGLEILAGGTSLGYVRSEAEFLEAKAGAMEILTLGEDRQEEALPETAYALKLVSPNRFSSAEAMRDALLALSDGSTADACGIYVDGSFLCAVKNQSDAKAVFDAALAAKQTAEADSMLSFLQHVTYEQGVYPTDGEVLWSRAELQDYVDLMMNMNYLRVKEMKTEIVNERVPCGSVEIPSDALYIGTSRVLTAGRDGTDQVTRLVTYVDGQETEAEELSRLSLTEPVPEQLQVGTRALDSSFVRTTSYGGILIWPAVGATNINSDYAYRWGKLHAALDIGSSVGTSLGKTVVAAAAGTVVIAGVHSSYGYYVKIDHGNGMQTLYAHCLAGSLLVNVGDHVDAGTPIARIGMTGYATGPHLHFEVIINGTCVDPKPYLGI